MTLILFDIDGTLLRGGAARDAFADALQEVYGTTGPIEDHDFSGKTDPQIARELLERVGMTRDAIRSRLPALWDGYLTRLADGLTRTPVTVLPGVRRLLDDLQGRPGIRMGVVTGNLADGARLKLGSAGLDGRFPVGAFGSDHEERNHLPGVAMARAARLWGQAFRGDAVVVVGDTPRDVECGRHHGVRTVAVATGQWSSAELDAAGAGRTLEDFSDLDATLEALLDRT